MQLEVQNTKLPITVGSANFQGQFIGESIYLFGPRGCMEFNSKIGNERHHRQRSKTPKCENMFCTGRCEKKIYCGKCKGCLEEGDVVIKMLKW